MNHQAGTFTDAKFPNETAVAPEQQYPGTCSLQHNVHVMGGRSLRSYLWLKPSTTYMFSSSSRTSPCMHLIVDGDWSFRESFRRIFELRVPSCPRYTLMVSEDASTEDLANRLTYTPNIPPDLMRRCFPACQERRGRGSGIFPTARVTH